MRVSLAATAALLSAVLIACGSPTAPPPEFIVVTATPGVATAAPPTEPTAAPTPDDGAPATFLSIVTPGNGTEWQSTDFIDVTGTARGMPNDDVLVFFVDAGRNVHGGACATLGPPNESGISSYVTDMTSPVNSELEGKIIAVVLDDDGSVAGSAGVFVTADPDLNDRHLTIQNPGNNCVIPNPGSFTVSGNGEGLPSQTITVQALSSAGAILQETTTTFSSAEGGTGTWSVEMSVSAAGQGTLRALSSDGADVVDSVSYTVFFGE